MLRCHCWLSLQCAQQPWCSLFLGFETLHLLKPSKGWQTQTTKACRQSGASNSTKEWGSVEPDIQDWSPHMSFILKGSQISTVQLKGWFKSKDINPRILKWNTKLILKLVHELELSFNSNEFGRVLLVIPSMFGKLRCMRRRSCGGLNQ